MEFFKILAQTNNRDGSQTGWVVGERLGIEKAEALARNVCKIATHVWIEDSKGIATPFHCLN